MKSFEQGCEELQKLLDLSNQCWFLGAGASAESNVPLMHALTSRVRACLNAQGQERFEQLLSDLPASAHVEHVLSHLGDLVAIAQRSQGQHARIGNVTLSLQDLTSTYADVVSAIAATVRYGFAPAIGGHPETIGDLQHPIVKVEQHRHFVEQLFGRRSNLEGRSKISFVTTNYDTLLEDALALERRVALDGFSGGAIGFWTGTDLDVGSYSARTHLLVKLHGSVDWFNDQSRGLLRVRYGVNYHSDLSETLIYPQATKYIETQKDPFARLFDCFRKILMLPDSHLLVFCGCSFGDDHVNSEIEHALRNRNNKTTIVAFYREQPSEQGVDGSSLCPLLERWRLDERFGPRIYIASDKALYCGSSRLARHGGGTLGWWSFRGLTDFLQRGDVI